MNKEDLIRRLTECVNEYCLDEEIYGDDPYLEFNPGSDIFRVITGEEADSSPFDCYPVMDLVEPSPSARDKFQPSRDNIEDLADELIG